MSAAFARMAYENNTTNYIRLCRRHLPGIHDKGYDIILKKLNKNIGKFLEK